MLIWLTCLVPAFLLAYHRGLKGVALALAGGMAVLSLTQVVVLVIGREEPRWTLLLAIVAIYVGICVGLAVFAEILHRERRAAEALALVDGLTGLPNRRHAEVTLDSQFAAAMRGRKLVVVMFDLDHFKQVNDRHGHKAGDTTLRTFGQVLKRNTRRMDLVARLGGEEFVSVLGETEMQHALLYANRVREQLKAEHFPWGQVTVSAGAAQYETGMGSWEVLVAEADRALYRAKQTGRDKIVVVETTIRPAPPAPIAVAAAPADIRSRGETILLIDDDLDVLRAVAKILRHAGYQVTETDDPEVAIQRFDGPQPPNLLVTDVMMPKMNGLTLVERISGMHPDLHVVYLSGYLQRDVSWAGLPGGVAGFVAKPVELQELLKVTRDVLDRTPAVATGA
jgi:diguanylate cyclase (GGDEF)-like protein